MALGNRMRLGFGACLCLDQTAHTQVLLDDDVVDGCHDEADLHRVSGAGEVGVDLLRGVLVETGELLANRSLDGGSCKS